MKSTDLVWVPLPTHSGTWVSRIPGSDVVKGWGINEVIVIDGAVFSSPGELTNESNAFEWAYVPDGPHPCAEIRGDVPHCVHEWVDPEGGPATYCEGCGDTRRVYYGDHDPKGGAVSTMSPGAR